MEEFPERLFNLMDLKMDMFLFLRQMILVLQCFTISFWINITLAQKDNNHAVGVLAFASSKGFWSNIVFYADNNAKTDNDSMDLKIHFNDKGVTDNWNFAGYIFSIAWPHMYDGVWRQKAFTL